MDEESKEKRERRPVPHPIVVRRVERAEPKKGFLRELAETLREPGIVELAVLVSVLILASLGGIGLILFL